MGWAAIIAVLLQIFGPLLAEWIKKWFDSHLRHAAALLPEPSFYADEPAARDALFEKAVATTRNPLRRLLLRRIARHAAALDVRAGDTAYTPPAAVVEELGDIAGAIETDLVGMAGDE
jgi:hypothetical protein